MLQPSWASSYIPTPRATKARFVPFLFGDEYLWSSARTGFNLSGNGEIGNYLGKPDHAFSLPLHFQVRQPISTTEGVIFSCCQNEIIYLIPNTSQHS